MLGFPNNFSNDNRHKPVALPLSYGPTKIIRDSDFINYFAIIKYFSRNCNNISRFFAGCDTVELMRITDHNALWFEKWNFECMSKFLSHCEHSGKSSIEIQVGNRRRRDEKDDFRETAKTFYAQNVSRRGGNTVVDRKKNDGKNIAIPLEKIEKRVED